MQSDALIGQSVQAAASNDLTGWPRAGLIYFKLRQRSQRIALARWWVSHYVLLICLAYYRCKYLYIVFTCLYHSATINLFINSLYFPRWSGLPQRQRWVFVIRVITGYTTGTPLYALGTLMYDLYYTVLRLYFFVPRHVVIVVANGLCFCINVFYEYICSYYVSMYIMYLCTLGIYVRYVSMNIMYLYTLSIYVHYVSIYIMLGLRAALTCCL